MQDGWSKKVQQRKGTGTGRMRYLKTIPRVYKNQIKGLAKWLWCSLFKPNYIIILVPLYISYHIEIHPFDVKFIKIMHKYTLKHWFRKMNKTI